MNPIVYNVSVLVGWLLASVGTGLINVPAGLIVSGLMLIGLTLFAASRLGGR